MGTPDEAAQRLQSIADRLRDMRPILEIVAADARTLIDDSFHTGTSPDGSPWAPLSEATISISPRRAGGKPLVDTARLRNSVTATADARSMRFGTNVRYAGPQNFGARVRLFGRGAQKTLPARPFLPIDGVPGNYTLMQRGRAGEHWSQARESIRRWLLTGEAR
jgi:phage gpG-like protein